MIVRATLAAVALWLAIGAGIEINAHYKRLMAAQARAHQVTQANFAKVTRFVDGCVRGEIAPLDELLYDCGKIRLLDTPARLVSTEMDEAERLWRVTHAQRTL